MGEAEKNLKKQISCASLLNERFGAACLEDPELGGLLLELEREIQKTDSLMLDSGVIAACTRCAKATGSCCFKEMGESYGHIQLFANRLLGSELPQKRQFPGGCFFVGEKGCRLKARHAFCLNYFCPELENILGEHGTLAIQLQVGKQLLAGWELERALGRRLSHPIPEHR
jgi:hypothetical protein